jgi:hypothetical protein
VNNRSIKDSRSLLDYLLGDATVGPVEPTRTDMDVDDDGSQQAAIEDGETAASAANTVKDTDGGNDTTPAKSVNDREITSGNENENKEIVEQLLDTFAEVKDHQGQCDEDDCTICSQPIRQHNLRRKSVSTLRRERQDFDGEWTNADSLAICKDCGRILDTHEVHNAI